MKRSTFTTREGLVMLFGSSPRAYRDAMARSVWDRASQPLKLGDAKVWNTGALCSRRIKIDFASSAEPSPGVRFLHREEEH
jgi:hypothetical protein